MYTGDQNNAKWQSYNSNFKFLHYSIIVHWKQRYSPRFTKHTSFLFSHVVYANQWPKYFVNQQYTTLTFANFRRPILRSRVIYKPFQKIVGEISIVRFTPSNINNLITSYSAFIDLSFFSYMMHTSSEERGPRVVVIYWEIRHEATESL